MIKDLRKAKGLTQQALATAAGVPLRAIQKYENGETQVENMTLGNAVKIAAALGVQPQDLIK